MPSSKIIDSFIKAACADRVTAHVAGTLDEANALLRQNPEISGYDIHVASILADENAVSHFLRHNPELAKSKGGPYQWDALTHLCFSRYLRLDKTRSEAFVRTTKLLLDAGADANTGFMEVGQYPDWEPVLYGAAGVAHHPGVTRLLLDHGANPNDGEVTYHSPESYDLEAFSMIIETGKLTQDSLAVMLVRKADWHDYDGVKLVLEHGADPNKLTIWGFTPLQHSLSRDNDIRIIQLMMDHGGDPIVSSPKFSSSVQVALHRGRGDFLELLKSRGIEIALSKPEEILAACAIGDNNFSQLVDSYPDSVKEVRRGGGTLLALYAGIGNTSGVKRLLQLGIPVNSLYESGDGYFDIAPRSTALHTAAWRGRSETVKFLIDKGADVNLKDGKGRSPLELAVKACVDSYWTNRRSPDSVKALLDAGAKVTQVLRDRLPCGYEPVDLLIMSDQ